MQQAGAAGDAQQVSRIQTYIALLHMYEGRFAEADAWIARAIDAARAPGMPAGLVANLVALRGVAALRRGETDNCIACVGPSSCIYPLAADAVHTRPDGSRAAQGYFLEYLRERPDDLGVRWLLNITAMTLGEYPDQVPRPFLIRAGPAPAHARIGRFRNVAAQAGLDVRGPNMSGGSVFDDFNGDGWPDIVTTSTDWDRGALSS